MQAEVDELFTIAASAPGRVALLGLIHSAWPRGRATEARHRKHCRALRLSGLASASAGLSRPARPDQRGLVRRSQPPGWPSATRAHAPRAGRRALAPHEPRRPDPLRPCARLESARWPARAIARQPSPVTWSIVGTGAGAGITAELLTAAGLNVVLIEEGPLQAAAPTSARSNPRPTPRCTRTAPAGRPPTRPSTSCRAAASAARPRSTGPVRSARPTADARPLAPAFRVARDERSGHVAVVPAGRAAPERVGPWLVPPER